MADNTTVTGTRPLVAGDILRVIVSHDAGVVLAGGGLNAADVRGRLTATLVRPA